MISNKLTLILLGHTIKSVEFSRKITIESITSFDNGLHDLVALFIGNSRAKREIRQISSNSYSCGLDERCFLIRERRAIELTCIHV
jgi:hypothetical protein